MPITVIFLRTWNQSINTLMKNYNQRAATGRPYCFSAAWESVSPVRRYTVQPSMGAARILWV